MFLLGLTGLLTGFSAFGSVIGYWRFEDSLNLGADSSGNVRTLSITGSPASLAFPGDIAVDFPNPVPLTGDPNARLLSISAANSGALFRADESAFYQTSFTFEAFVRPTTNDATFRHIASQTGTGQSQWRLGYVSASSSLVFSLSSNGTSWANFSTTLSGVSVGDSLYVAASAEVDSVNGTSVRVYHQNLTTAGLLQTALYASPSLTSLFDSAATLAIGGLSLGSANQWRGEIDEARLSDSVLALNELLVVPEPGTAMLTLLGLAGMALRRRRRTAN